jgi:superfamily II DNA or RNA helicase
VALVQSLYKCARQVAPYIGHLVVDECHRAPARTFTEAVTAFDCKYMLGLSATPWRRDGLSKLIYWYLGRKVFEIDRQELTDPGSGCMRRNFPCLFIPKLSKLAPKRLFSWLGSWTV